VLEAAADGVVGAGVAVVGAWEGLLLGDLEG